MAKKKANGDGAVATSDAPASIPRIKFPADVQFPPLFLFTVGATCRAWDSGDTFSTALFCGQGRYGNNASGGHWEVAINSTTAHRDWDGNGGDFNTGIVSVEMAVDGSTSESLADWTVGGNVVSRTGAGYNQIQKVGVRAEVTKPPSPNPDYDLHVSWETLNVTFYNGLGGSDPFTATDSCRPKADAALGTMLRPNQRPLSVVGIRATSESTKIIVPSTGFVPSRVVVAGTVKMWSTTNPTPTLGPSQLVFKVYVWTA
jgi:hypothetical protein